MIIKINEAEAACIIEQHLSEHFEIFEIKGKKLGCRVWTECDQDDNITFNCETVCP